MSGFDIATVLSVHPDLLWTFHDRIMTTNCMKSNDWEYLLKYQPQFSFLSNIKKVK
ncbi:MAG: hypothetical protein HKO92_02245 [Flavobacteriaceae bacterium]|nr:hypothetical protein [Flavobacteriaceae bacterium]